MSEFSFEILGEEQANKDIKKNQEQEFNGFVVGGDELLEHDAKVNQNAPLDYKFNYNFDEVKAMELGHELMAPKQEEMVLHVHHQVMHAPKSMSERIFKTNQDTAALGSKSFKSNTDYKRERNARITAAKKIHKNATAYTLEMSEHIKTLQKERSERDLEQKINVDNNDVMLSRLEKINFNPQMFYGANIRQNFAYYMSIVYDYQDLKKSLDESVLDLDEENKQKDRFRNIKDVMEAFVTRMKVFCESNMIHLDGTALGKKERPARLNLENVKQWSELTGKYENERKTKYDISKEELNLDEEAFHQEGYQNEEIISLVDVEELVSPTLRIKNINKIRYALSTLDSTINTQLQFYKDNSAQLNERNNPELYNQWLGDLAMLRRQKTLYMSYFILANREYDYCKAKASGNLDDADDMDELAKKAKEAWDDLCIVESAFHKETASRRKVKATHSIMEVSAGEAMMTDSDMKSMEYREKLYDYHSNIVDIVSGQERLRKNQRTMSKDSIKSLKSLGEALDKYTKNDMYTAGKETERDYLINVYEKIKRAKRYNPDGEGANIISKIESYLRNMSDGSLSVPEGAQVLDASLHEPKNSGAKSGGWKRNALLTSISYFKDMKDVPLFAHEPTANDIQQKMVTNCYMVSAITSIVELSPSIIKNALKDNGDGTATVRLYQEQNGKMEPVYVKVKKSVPKVFGADMASSGALWMQMIEKAVAVVGMKKRGVLAKGYRGLWYDSGAVLISMLTGAPYDQVDGTKDMKTTTEDERKLKFERIMNWKQEKKVYTCGSHAYAKHVQPGHAYAIIGARYENGQRILRLRNPYSQASTVYDYGKDAETLTKKGHLDFMGSPDENFGQFDIKWEDFWEDFTGININDMSGVIDNKQEEEPQVNEEVEIRNDISIDYDDNDEDDF